MLVTTLLLSASWFCHGVCGYAQPFDDGAYFLTPNIPLQDAVGYGDDAESAFAEATNSCPMGEQGAPVLLTVLVPVAPDDPHEFVKADVASACREGPEVR